MRVILAIKFDLKMQLKSHAISKWDRIAHKLLALSKLSKRKWHIFSWLTFQSEHHLYFD